MEDLKKRYTNFLKKGEFALLKSGDEFFGAHYKGSPLWLLTGFSGTCGEALIDYTGKITIFVDPRYHEQADFECKKNGVDVVKMAQGKGFVEYITNFIKGANLYLPNSTLLSFFKNLEKKGAKIKTYKDFEDFGKNENLDKTKEIFEVSKKITEKSFNEKVEILKNKAKARYMLVSSVDEVAYLTNLRSFQLKDTSTFKAKLLLDFSGKSILFCDDLIKSLPENLELKPISEFNNYISKIKEEILINKNFITLNDFSKIKKPKFLATNYIANMASIKTKGEIKHLKSAFMRLDKALWAFKAKLKEGQSELEIKELFEKELFAQGALATSFNTILGISENSSSIHYTNCSEKRKLKKGDTILIDCGGYFEGGLATDITRVIAFGENKSELKKEIYTATLKAFLNCYHSNFKTGFELDLLARKILNPYKKKGFLFPHGLGHGIGVPVHQAPPVISSFSKRLYPIYKNMTHTIEPGLYGEFEGEKFGIRLENSVFQKNSKTRESFSKFEFEEKLINYEMLTKKEQKWLSDWQKDAKEFYERNC